MIARRAVVRRLVRCDLLTCAAQHARRRSIGNAGTRHGGPCAFLRRKVVLFQCIYRLTSREEGGNEGRTDGPAVDVGYVIRPLQQFRAGVGRGPPGDVHDAIEWSDVEQPWRKVDVEEAIRVAETMWRALAYSSQRLFRTRKLDVCEPIRCCAYMSITLLE